MTSRHKNSSHGRFSKKQKKASRFMMTTMRRGYQFDRHGAGADQVMKEIGKAGILASILPFLFSRRGRGG